MGLASGLVLVSGNFPSVYDYNCRPIAKNIYHLIFFISCIFMANVALIHVLFFF